MCRFRDPFAFFVYRDEECPAKYEQAAEHHDVVILSPTKMVESKTPNTGNR